MRSVWKFAYYNPRITHQSIKDNFLLQLKKEFKYRRRYEKDKVPDYMKIWSRSSDISRKFLYRKVRIHTGKQFHEVKITKFMLGLKFGALTLTKKIGSLIHKESKRNKKKLLKKKNKNHNAK